MDFLEEKRTLIDAVDCKIVQLTELREKLIQEHNAEAIRIQKAAQKVQPAHQQEVVEEKLVEENTKKSK